LYLRAGRSSRQKMHISHQQNDFASHHSERTGAKTDHDGQNRSPSTIYLETGPPVFGAFKTSAWQGRFRICRKIAAGEDATQTGCGLDRFSPEARLRDVLGL